MRTERADVTSLLQQMRQMQEQMRTQQSAQQGIAADRIGGMNPLGQTQETQATGFGDLFKQAVQSVNETQKQSSALATAYEQGDPQVSLAQVMVASQKSSVAFQALTQVRNRLVEAYQDVMNMPI